MKMCITGSNVKIIEENIVKNYEIKNELNNGAAIPLKKRRNYMPRKQILTIDRNV